MSSYRHHALTRHRSRTQLPEKYLGQSTSLMVLEIWAVENFLKTFKFLDSNFSETACALPELSEPLRVPPWALHC